MAPAIAPLAGWREGKEDLSTLVFHPTSRACQPSYLCERRNGRVAVRTPAYVDPDYVYSLIRTVCEAITNTRIEDLKKPDGSFKPMNEWPAGAFRAVRGITMNPGTNRVIDVELEDQEAARRMLARLAPRPATH